MSQAVRDTRFLHKSLFGGKAEKKRESFAKRNLKKQKQIIAEAKEAIDKCSILLPNESGYIKTQEGEKSFKLSQAKLLDAVDIGTRQKVLNLQLSHGPYYVDYTSNGRYLLLGGSKGQLSLIDVHESRPHFDISLKETIRDVKFLHSHEMVATAQKKYTHIYNNSGAEVYCLRERMLTYKLEYLRFHYLLVGIGEFGELWYQDISTGQVVTTHKTKQGACKVMKQNPGNAVIHLGHNDGIVSLWTPNIAKACVKVLCHKGPVTGISIFDNYMITGGYDGYWKLWDLRNYKESFCKAYIGSTPPSSMDTSQTGVLAMAFGGRVELYNKIYQASNNTKSHMYLSHSISSQNISGLRFQPFEDVLAIGSTYGVSTIIVPGSGIANFDSFEDNPYLNDKNRQVQKLLDKLPPETITLVQAEIGTYNRQLAAVDPSESVGASRVKSIPSTSSGSAIYPDEPKDKKKKKHKHKGKRLKSAEYNKTFLRRQQAIADKIKAAGSVDKEKLIGEMTQQAPDGSMRVGGNVRGAALSRYSKKSN